MSGEMKPTRSIDSIFSGLLAGLVCAFWGTVLFAVLQVNWPEVRRDPDHPEIAAIVIIVIVFYGCLFSFIPAGIGGAVLGLRLQRQMQKERLTLKNAVKTGMLLGGLAAIVTCGLGVLAWLSTPHNYWRLFLYDVSEENFLAILYKFVQNYMNTTSGLLPEILKAITIACLAGGLAGRYLAKKFLAVKTNVSE
jgi:hypothetical protein